MKNEHTDVDIGSYVKEMNYGPFTIIDTFPRLFTDQSCVLPNVIAIITPHKLEQMTCLCEMLKFLCVSMNETDRFIITYREYVYSVAVYKEYLTRFGELIIFEPWLENYHFSQPN